MWIFVGLFMLAIALFVLAYGYKMIKAFYLDGLFKTFLLIIFILFIVGGFITFVASIAGPSDPLIGGGGQIQLIILLFIPVYTVFYFWLKHMVKKHQQNNNDS